MPKMKSTTILSGLFGLLLGLTGIAHADTVTYIYTDAQGTPLAEADAQGNITATFDYRPYGSIALGTAPKGPGYTGHVNDPDTGLVYMQARYYDPTIGRFLSRDPAGQRASFNDYAYVNDNPINSIDPTGMFQCANKASCEAGQKISAGFKKAQSHFKSGSAAYKSLAAGIKALGTPNDGGAIQVTVKSDSKDLAVGRGAYDEEKNTQTLTVNLAQLNTPGYTDEQNSAELTATGAHEIKHITDDVANKGKPHDIPDEFWHEVRGVRAETPVWEGLGVDDPLGTWTSSGSLDMKNVYKEAQWSTNNYCPNGKCP
jgi:RHS repeat-associated protein